MRREHELLLRELISELQAGNVKRTIAYFRERLPEKPTKKEKDKDAFQAVINDYRQKLVKNITPSEKRVFTYLKKHMINFKFQHPIIVSKHQFYFMGFYLPDKRIAVELDGKQHYEEENKLKDQYRTRNIELKGIKVIRFDNSETIKEEEFMVKLRDYLSKAQQQPKCSSNE